MRKRGRSSLLRHVDQLQKALISSCADEVFGDSTLDSTELLWLCIMLTVRKLAERSVLCNVRVTGQYLSRDIMEVGT